MNTTQRKSTAASYFKQPLWFLVSFIALLGLSVFFIIALFFSKPAEDCQAKSDVAKPIVDTVLTLPPELPLDLNDVDNDNPAPSDEQRQSQMSVPVAVVPTANKFGCQLPAILPAEPVVKTDVSFQQWQQTTIEVAKMHHISAKTIEATFQRLKPDPKIIALDRRQAEYATPFAKYLSNSISVVRITTGKAMLKQHAKRLQVLEKKYGVQGSILVALWAMESNFGYNIGNTPTINTLATLAHDGRRAQFFQNELRCALQIIEEGHIQPQQMKSSWAGAMGQTQFMPSTFVHYSADGDSDGKKDIWRNSADALASAANYLSQIGWQAKQSWGMEVKLPKAFELYQARFSAQKSLQEWHKLGVTQANGMPLPNKEIKGAVILPSGSKGPAFLVYHNFSMIREWNRSMHYALAVGHLADRLSGKGSLVVKPPNNEKPLSRQQALALQTALRDLGFYHDKIDGMLGLKSHDAIREYQRSHGIPADAYPSTTLVSQIIEQSKSIQ